jgi:hypothetical protein
LIQNEPISESLIRPLIGAQEFLQGKERWCLWLADEVDSAAFDIYEVRCRVKKVREMRLESRKAATKKIASTPHLFAEDRHPRGGSYILVPRHTSCRRDYAPVGFFDSSVIATDAVQIIPHGTLYDFGIITSSMHIAWMRLVCGRIKSDYRYSTKLVYNTFPWPEATEAQRHNVETLSRAVILARAAHPDKTMAQLYDPDKMPENMLEAHEALDRAVEKLYRDRPFRDTAERQEYLLARYEELIKVEKAAKVEGQKKPRKATTTEG